MNAGRQKLKRLGIDLPPLPITAVGSFPKPPELTPLRAAVRRGDAEEADLRRAEEQATATWMGFQNEIGVDVAVDGEMYRTDMVEYFARAMDGFAISGWVRSYGNRFYRKPIMTSDVRWRGPITVDWWKLAQSMTDQPVKGMLTGGYTVMDWSFDEHYPSRRTAALDIAAQLRYEVDALIQAGCKIVQIDEPALSVRIAEVELVAECMSITTQGLDAYFVTHSCYGEFDTVFSTMSRIPVDNFDLEMTNSGFSLIDAFERHGFAKDLSAGVVDPHNHVIEDPDQVEKLIRTALEAIPADQLWIDPDCGLKTRTIEEAQAKMRVLANATKKVRSELTG